MASEGFATLIPAFTVRAYLDPPFALGPASQIPGGLTIVPVPSGTLVSEPSYPLQIDAKFLNGSDFIRADASGKFLRLDVKSLLEDKSGARIALYYTGQIELNEEIGKIFGGAPDAKTVGFGNVASHVTFHTGAEEFRLLEQRLYVGNGRFVLEDGKLIVEYKISQIQS